MDESKVLAALPPDFQAKCAAAGIDWRQMILSLLPLFLKIIEDWLTTKPTPPGPTVP